MVNPLILVAAALAFGLLVVSSGSTASAVPSLVFRMPGTSGRQAAAQALCDLPGDELDAQAKDWATRSVKAMRKAAQSSLKSKREEFPCNDPERKSWVIHNAFKGMSGGRFNESADIHYSIPGGKTARPWNVLTPGGPPPGGTYGQHEDWSLDSTASDAHRRIVRKREDRPAVLTECELYIYQLLEHYATAACPGVTTKPHPTASTG